MLPWALLLACQEPFGRDRHDLVGFRIAALTARMEGALVRPRVAMVVDGRLYSDDPVELRWGWVDDEGDAAALDRFVAEGPAPRLSIEGDRLALVARHGEREARAELAIDALPAPLLPRIAMDVLPVDLDVEAAQLDIENRRRWSGEPGRAVAPGGFARFSVLDAPSGTRARFMATGAGTFFELDATRTDWVAGTLTVEDDAITARAAAPEGPVTLLALVLDGAHGFGALDFHVGALPDGSWTGGRFLPGGIDVPFVGTLAADARSPTGLRVDDVRPATDEDRATWSADVLGCIDVEGPFDPSWLLDQRCTRAVLDGVRVYVEPDP